VTLAGVNVWMQTQVGLDELVVLGLEGSANKIGVGIVTSSGRILANPREVCR
jgi:hypothetical protein